MIAQRRTKHDAAFDYFPPHRADPAGGRLTCGSLTIDTGSSTGRRDVSALGRLGSEARAAIKGLPGGAAAAAAATRPLGTLLDNA